MTNKLGNINYQAIMARANADMQKLQSISSGSNWEEILAILQGEMKNQLPGAGKSIFSIGEDIQGIASGNASQQASAFQNILNDITSLIGNLSTKDSAQANQEVKKNDNEIQKNDQEATNLNQTVDAKLQQIMDQCTNGAKTIEDAIKEIEALGGDKGKIASAQEELDQHLATIEENKQILNNGVSSPEEKKQALSNILNAASAINSLVILVNGYKEQIEAQNAIVEETSNNLAELTTNANQILTDGMTKMAELVQNNQAQTVKTSEMAVKGTTKEVAGNTQVIIGEGMTSGPQAMFTGSEGFKYIMSGNDKINAGATLMGGATQGLSKLTQSMGQMGSYLQYFANFANGIGKFGEGAQELLGQYDTTVNASITAIGSWEQVGSANEQLQAYIQEYTSDMGSNEKNVSKGSKTTQNNNERQTEVENTDADEMNFKEFLFDTNIFKAS